MTSYRFHHKAAAEYLEATRYYLLNSSPVVAESFSGEVEAAIRKLALHPTMWPCIDNTSIRRFIMSRFPYAIYYHWDPEMDCVTIYAVMHMRRVPRYWADRVRE